MRIGLDATNLLLPIRTGIERYTTELAVSLSELLPEESGAELYLYFHAGRAGADLASLDGFLSRSNRCRRRVYPWRKCWYRPVLPALALVDRLDLLHFPSPMVPPHCPCPMIVTFHDVCWVRSPSGEDQGVAESYARRAVRKARAFVAVSEATKRDLTEIYGIESDRVWVIGEGVDPAYQPSPQEAERVRRAYSLPRYILYVGTLQRRKNLIRLMQAFSILKHEHSVPHLLVVAGSEGWGHEEVYDAVAKPRLDSCVRFLGYVPENDLPGLYSGADLFVYPSLYEGFGLPVLEAMACGTVVAVSNCSSLPEVVDDAGLFFDPRDPDGLAAVIHEGLSDTALRSKMRAAGLERARHFSWVETGRQTLQMYREVLGQL